MIFTIFIVVIRNAVWFLPPNFFTRLQQWLLQFQVGYEVVVSHFELISGMTHNTYQISPEFRKDKFQDVSCATNSRK